MRKCEMQNAKCKMRKCKMQNAKCEMQKCEMQNAKCKMQNAKMQNAQKAKPFTPLPKGRGKAACGGLGVGLLISQSPSPDTLPGCSAPS
ncbi:MAG: hypothetical protein UHO69_10160, partial [Prevotella sp.]|nr:hypothetical protein [Prevotella sp.]